MCSVYLAAKCGRPARVPRYLPIQPIVQALLPAPVPVAPLWWAAGVLGLHTQSKVPGKLHIQWGCEARSNDRGV